MNVTIFVEQIDAGRYRAATSQPVPLQSEGSSPDEAVRRLRDLAEERIAGGVVVQIELPASPTPNPWVEFAGVWKDHPDFDAFRENIAAHRRQIDEAEACA